MTNERNSGGRSEYDTPRDIGLRNPSGEALAIANMGLTLNAMSATCGTLARRLDEAVGVERAALLIAAGREFREFADIAHDTGREFHEIGTGIAPGFSDRPRPTPRRAGVIARLRAWLKRAFTNGTKEI